jgi:hypothetical protein
LQEMASMPANKTPAWVRRDDFMTSGKWIRTL